MKFTLTIHPAPGRFDETVAALAKLGAEITNISVDDNASRLAALKAKTPWSNKFHGNRYTGKLKKHPNSRERNPGGKRSRPGDGSIEGEIMTIVEPLESYTRDIIVEHLPQYKREQVVNAIRRMVQKGGLTGLEQEAVNEGASE